MPPRTSTAGPVNRARRSRKGRAKRERGRLLLALIPAVLAAMGTAVTYGIKGFNYLERPQVSITSPINGSVVASRAFGVSGTASHIPANFDLWVVDWPDQDRNWYPVAGVDAPNGKWSLPEKQVCPNIGLHAIQVWMVPDSSVDVFNKYIHRKVYSNYKWNPGLETPPPGAVPKASVMVRVPSSLKSCS